MSTALPGLSLIGMDIADESTPLSEAAQSPSLLQKLWQDLVLSGAVNAPWGLNVPATAAVSLGALKGGITSWFGLRGITLMLGLLLIAAALFSHPAVRLQIARTGKTAVRAGKTAGKVAAAVAA